MTLKEHLYQLCQQYVEQRIECTKVAMATTQASANNELKSSAGDKYETGRAMMQLEIEKYTEQLNQALTLKQTLKQIAPEKVSHSIELGSVIRTDKGNFFLSISAGLLLFNEQQYYAISKASPVGSKFYGKCKGDTVQSNGITYVIEDVM